MKARLPSFMVVLVSIMVVRGEHDVDRAVLASLSARHASTRLLIRVHFPLLSLCH